ncbi:MAG: nucleotidyltransferase domain-containing protein [Bdellovibrionales bacterium]|nr:nucleotidyltransferase domain-containing protein [Bdellovibrionales bacterium]
MSLLKLVHNPEMNAWAQKRAVEILNSIPSQDLILEAYLFGSAVCGNFTVDSDLDFIVIAKDQGSIKQLQKEVYAPRFADIAIDWIFKTKESFDERKNFGGVCFIAFREGIRLR